VDLNTMRKFSLLACVDGVYCSYILEVRKDPSQSQVAGMIINSLNGPEVRYELGWQYEPTGYRGFKDHFRRAIMTLLLFETGVDSGRIRPLAGGSTNSNVIGRPFHSKQPAAVIIPAMLSLHP
jgi:hypothetical protein